MKNTFTKTFLFSITMLTGSNYLSAQNEKSKCMDAETVPNAQTVGKNEALPGTQALWTVLYNYDLKAAVGSNGNAAVCFFGNEFWVSRWQNDTIQILDASGVLVQKINISGVTGVRSFTTDGTYIYAGVGNNSIKKIDPATKTLVGTITAPIAAVRSLTYDPTVGGGAGGFWASTWNTDITQFDMTGIATGITVSAGAHGLVAMYGTAYDPFTANGPYFWIFDQSPTGKLAHIYQFDILNQVQVGVMHDVATDVGIPVGDTSSLAGGIFIYPQPGLLSLIGVSQGGPTNRLFAYDLDVSVGINENTNPESFVSIYPNPVKDFVNISLNKQNNDEVHLQIFDVTGKTIFDRNTRGLNNYINLSRFQSGMYFVKASYNNQIFTAKLIKE